MQGLRVLLGGVVGYLLGVAVWAAASSLATCYAEGRTPRLSARAFWVMDRDGMALLPAALAGAGMALWSAYVGWKGLELDRAASSLVGSALLATISVVDWRVRRIPNVLVLALLAWALVQMAWLGQPSPLSAALGLLVGGGTFLLLALVRAGAMGAGDVKLVAALGAVLGFPEILQALFWGVLAGGVAALVLLSMRRAGRKDYMAYGPYLALGGWIVWTRVLGLWA